MTVLSAGDAVPAGEDAAAADAADGSADGQGADAFAEADADTDDGWPGPTGTVAVVASGLVGAESIEVDEGYVYIAVSEIDAGVDRVVKRGGAPEHVVPSQSYVSSVRSTPSGVVWAAPYATPPGVWTLPRDGGAPSAVTSTGARLLDTDGNRVAFHGNGSRVMLAELDKGSVRPIAEDQLAVGGFAFDGDRVVWTAKCSAGICNAFVMSSPLAAPAPVTVWSRTPVTAASMGGIALSNGTIAFSYQSVAGPAFARLPPGSNMPVDLGGKTPVVSTLRRDGLYAVFLTSNGSSVTLTRRAIDGSGVPAELATTTGTIGAVALDTRVIYWISKEEGVLRAIAR